MIYCQCTIFQLFYQALTNLKCFCSFHGLTLLKEFWNFFKTILIQSCNMFYINQACTGLHRKNIGRCLFFFVVFFLFARTSIHSVRTTRYFPSMVDPCTWTIRYDAIPLSSSYRFHLGEDEMVAPELRTSS